VYPDVHVPRIREFDALMACGVIISSPFTNKVHFSSIVRGRKDCGMTARAPQAPIIGLEPDVSSLV
jgi:hypothetical protein